MRWWLLVGLVAGTGCMEVTSQADIVTRDAGGPPPVRGPSNVTPPGEDVFEAVKAGATGVLAASETAVSIDLVACEYERLLVGLPLGSAWFLVHPRDASYCEMWLGGETENPRYDGSPAQYCVFDRYSTLVVQPSQGGPILMQDMPWCVLL